LAKSIASETKQLPEGVKLYNGLLVTDKDRAKEIRQQVRKDLREQLKAEAKAAGLRGDAMTEEVNRRLEEKLPAALESAYREAGILAGEQAGIGMGKALGEGIEEGLDKELSKSNVIPDQLKKQLEELENASGVEGFADKWEDALSATAQVFDHYIGEISDKWEQAMKDSGLADLPATIAEANANQLMQDLGFQGNGALPTLVREIRNGSFTPQQEEHIHYHVEDVTDAERQQNNRRNRERLQYTQR